MEPTLFHSILVLRLSNMVDQRPRTDIVREIFSSGYNDPNTADLSLVLIFLYREALYIQL